MAEILFPYDIYYVSMIHLLWYKLNILLNAKIISYVKYIYIDVCDLIFRNDDIYCQKSYSKCHFAIAYYPKGDLYF